MTVSHKPPRSLFALKVLIVFHCFKPHGSDHLLLHGVVSLFTVFTRTTPLGVYGKLSETTYR